MLTVYLNTDRSDPDQQGGEWKIALKNGFNRLEEYLESAPEEQERLKDLRLKVEEYVHSKERELPRSFIFFASRDSGIWEALELQVPVETNFYWEEDPMLDALKELHGEWLIVRTGSSVFVMKFSIWSIWVFAFSSQSTTVTSFPSAFALEVISSICCAQT